MAYTPEEQLRGIKSGIADLVPEESLLEKLRSGRPLAVKLGVDPTAPDLHLGHAVPLRKLRTFQDYGHRVILIIGDFTALIGDPSGRNTTRPALSASQIDENAATYIEQAFRILDPASTVLRRNSEWLGDLDFSRILQLTSQFTVARILERDDFRKRYEGQQSISLHEFLYPVAQAYDSVAISADVELGGTDQLFNLLAGRELMEKLGMEPQVCLTLPLLEGTDGVQKMSKSYGNYIGLTDQADDMFGKVMSIPDAVMPKYFRLATALPVEEVDLIEGSLESGSADPNSTKRRLAREIVSLYHGDGAAEAAEQAFDTVFKHGGRPAAIPDCLVPADDPELQGDRVYLPHLFKNAAVGVAASGGEARRLVDQGAVKIDGVAVTSYEVPAGDVWGHDFQIGKRVWFRPVRADV